MPYDPALVTPSLESSARTQPPSARTVTLLRIRLFHVGRGINNLLSHGMRKFLAAIQDGLIKRHAVFERPINRKLMISIERHHAIRAVTAHTEKHGRVVRNVVVEKIRKCSTHSTE
jgi:hypothetical protein